MYLFEPLEIVIYLWSNRAKCRPFHVVEPNSNNYYNYYGSNCKWEMGNCSTTSKKTKKTQKNGRPHILIDYKWKEGIFIREGAKSRGYHGTIFLI